MKEVIVLVSSNGWEYADKVVLSYETSIKVTSSGLREYYDSLGNPAPNVIILDDKYRIVFDEGFEIVENHEMLPKANIV